MVLQYQYNIHYTTMTDKVQAKVYLPPDVKALLDADSRSNSEAVEAALISEYGGQRNSALQQRIEEKEQRIDVIKKEKEAREEELTELREDLEGLRNQIEQANKKRYEDLDSVLDDMAALESTMHANHPTMDKIAANWFNGDNQKAFKALQERNEQRDDPIPEDRFTEAQ